MLLELSFALLACAQTPFAANGSLPEAPAPSLRPCAPQFFATPQWRDATPMSTATSCGASAWPWSARYSPLGDRLYVTSFGGFIGVGGCRVLRLDPATMQTLASIPTGESPQDIELVTHANGSIRYGFVNCSSASVVTVFDGADAVVATIPIPFTPGGLFPTAFPTSLTKSPDQSVVYVSTSNGEGWIHAIDVHTLQLDPARAVFLGAQHSASRMAFAGSLLVIPASEALPNWVGSTAKVFVVDPAQPGALQQLALATASTGSLFPSPQDCAVDCDGTVWVAGFDMGARVFGVDPRTATLRYIVPTHTSQPEGKFQALGLSKDGVLVVGDFWTHELSVINARARRWRATIDTASLPQVQRGPQDIEFEPSGRSFVAPWAATDNVGRFDL